MSDEIEARTIRCIVCKRALDPRGEHALVEFDAESTGPGFRVGHVCDLCAPELAAKIDECGGDSA